MQIKKYPSEVMKQVLGQNKYPLERVECMLPPFWFSHLSFCLGGGAKESDKVDVLVFSVVWTRYQGMFKPLNY